MAARDGATDSPGPSTSLPAGDARDSWLHAIRPGVEVDLADGAAVCDWWGQTDYLVRRSPSRISIVLAFAEG